MSSIIRRRSGVMAGSWNHEVRKKNHRRHDAVVELQEHGGRCSDTRERKEGEIEAEGTAEEKTGVKLGRRARGQHLRPTAKRFSSTHFIRTITDRENDARVSVVNDYSYLTVRKRLAWVMAEFRASITGFSPTLQKCQQPRCPEGGRAFRLNIVSDVRF